MHTKILFSQCLDVMDVKEVRRAEQRLSVREIVLIQDHLCKIEETMRLENMQRVTRVLWKSAHVDN